jgi:transposase
LEQLHERRKQVVRLDLRGTGVMQIAALTGPSYATVRKTIDLFFAGGWSAIDEDPGCSLRAGTRHPWLWPARPSSACV